MSITRRSVIPLLVLVTLMSTGCHRGNEATSSTASPSSLSAHTAEQALEKCPNPGEAVRADATSVAVTYENIAYCWDSTKDPSTQAATTRALALASGPWKDTQAAAKPPNAFQEQFDTAAHFNGVTDVTVSPAGDGVDAGTDAETTQRTVDITWTWVGDDGQKAPGGRAQDIVYLEKNAGQWEVIATENTHMRTNE